MPRLATSPHRSTLVLGLGLTGYSLVRHLATSMRDDPSQLTVADSRATPPFAAQVRREFPQVNMMTGALPFAHLDRFDEIIASPGLDLRPAPPQTRARIIGDIELFARAVQPNAKIIGITGSNGKSTVTMLVAKMLKAAGMTVATGGNIGPPALDLLTAAPPDWYVLELSSFQLEGVRSLSLACATVLNISADHLDRYPALTQYRTAKHRIYHRAAHTVSNRDDAQTTPPPSPSPTPPRVTFGLNPPPTANDFGVVADALVHGDTRLAETRALHLAGRQNVANVLAAAGIVAQCGARLSPVVIAAACDFTGLPHRYAPIGQWQGVDWINDSKATNVGAAIAAIIATAGERAAARSVVLIVGGQGKGADFAPLAAVIATAVKHTIVFGEDARAIAAHLAAPHYTLVADLPAAVQTAARHAVAGDSVLFAPACASFDLFDDYAQRGTVFTELVAARHMPPPMTSPSTPRPHHAPR